MPQRLSAAQAQQYHDEGFLIVDEPIFPPDKFTAFKARFEMHLQIWERVTGTAPELIDRAHFIDPQLHTWLLADEVLDLVEPLIGPDIALFASSCFNKFADNGKEVPWHEDGSYWGDLAENRIEVATVWLAIDPSTRENGCMRVIPGSHRQRDRQHEKVESDRKTLLANSVQADLFDEATAVDCVLQANQCSLHDAYLIHGSNATQDQTRRCGYQMRYMPTTVKSSTFEGQQVYLARGVDRAGNQYADPNRVNDQWLDADPQRRQLAELCAAS